MDKRERDQVEHGRANGPLQADVRNFVEAVEEQVNTKGDEPDWREHHTPADQELDALDQAFGDRAAAAGHKRKQDDDRDRDQRDGDDLLPQLRVQVERELSLRGGRFFFASGHKVF